MILQTRCTKCNGNVIERDGIDGMEQLCLNCGFGQTATIIPTQALADDAEDYQIRNRSDGWSDTYLDLYGTRRTNRGQLGKTNRLGTTSKKQYQQRKRENKRQTVTKETIDTWKRINKELELHQEKD